MKNVTATMEDSAAGWARLAAARRHTSVSRCVGEMVAEKIHRADRCARALKPALEFRPLAFASPSLTRDDIHAERLDRFR